MLCSEVYAYIFTIHPQQYVSSETSSVKDDDDFSFSDGPSHFATTDATSPFSHCPPACSSSASSHASTSYSRLNSEGRSSSYSHSNASISSERYELRTADFRIPLSLSRPDNTRDIDYSSLELDAELSTIPFTYILEQLESSGPSLLCVVTETSVGVPPSSSTLPAMLPIRKGAEGHMTPGYVLAITSDDNPRTLLLPVHGLVMATNCNSLSTMAGSYPFSIPILADNAQGTLINTPVVHVHLPSSAAFSILAPYFYTHSSSSLLAALLPPTPSHSSIETLIADTPNVLASRLSVVEQPALLEHVNLVHSVWQTSVALGAAHDGLWRTMEVAWSVLVGALAIKEGRKVRD